jgi:hypothetical protein
MQKMPLFNVMACSIRARHTLECGEGSAGIDVVDVTTLQMRDDIRRLPACALQSAGDTTGCRNHCQV